MYEGTSIEPNVVKMRMPSPKTVLYMVKRGYNSTMITEQKRAGEWYKLNRAVSVLNADFDMFPEEEDYFLRYRMLNVKSHREFSDKIEYNLLILPKLPVETDFSLIWDWLNFLKVETRKDVERVRPNSPELQKAIDELEKICQNPQEREKYEYREKALRDYIDDVLSNYEVGYEKGREEGREEGRYELVRKALASGKSPKEIAGFLGISLDLVLEIQEKK